MFGYVEHFCRSISVCRSLMGSETDKLAKFDAIVAKGGFERLTRADYRMPLAYNLKEIERELEWLQTFLTNVKESDAEFHQLRELLGFHVSPPPSQHSQSQELEGSQPEPPIVPPLPPAAALQEEHWCVCGGPSEGYMIACENDKCPIEWFHIGCVGLKKKDMNKSWYCSLCQPKKRRRR